MNKRELIAALADVPDEMEVGVEIGTVDPDTNSADDLDGIGIYGTYVMDFSDGAGTGRKICLLQINRNDSALERWQQTPTNATI